jgi:hypothetical protein
MRLRFRYVSMLAGLGMLAAVLAARETAGIEIGRGRQILLGRGLQIQGIAQEGLSDLSRWQSANFTTLNFMANRVPSLLAQPQLAGQQWGCCYALGFSDRYKYLTPAEMTYAANLASFQCYDEPEDAATTERQADIAATYRQWNSLYPNTLAYTNFTEYAQVGGSIDGLRQYMRATQPDMLMHDFYPSYTQFSDYRPTWYSYMQGYRTVALEGYDGTGQQPLPYGQYLKTYRVSPSDPLPSESFIRLQQFASWAFGYTFVSDFVYNDMSSAVNSVVFSATGESSPTRVFNYVAETNRQSRNLSPALVRLASTDIRMVPGKVNTHANSLPDGISAWQRGGQNTGGHADYITGITQRGKTNTSSPSNCSDVLVGYFQPLLPQTGSPIFADDFCFMIVNGAAGTAFAEDDPAGDPALNSAEWFRINFDFGTSGFNSLARLSRDTGKVELVALQHLSGGDGALYRLDLKLDGGTGDLFRFWNSSAALPAVPEPSTAALLLTGLVGGLYSASRKRS